MSELDERYAGTVTPAIVRMPANTLGRDFVMGDLHGEVGQLRQRLADVGFDGRVDRLFSVGDLIDRGEDSLAALQLLQEPWFFAVLGNHERMMLAHLLEPEKPSLWLENGGDWHTSVERMQLSALAEQVRRLPLIRIVGEGVSRFQIVHAELPDADRFLEREWTAYDIEVATWSRAISKEVCAFQAYESLTLPHAKPIESHEVENAVNYKPIDLDWALTFCGHCVVERPMLWRSHYFLDTGCGWRGGVLTLMNVADALIQYQHFKAKERARPG